MILIKKQNLYLMHASKYLQHFNLNIHYKSKKQHIVLNILSRLILTMLSETNMKKDELNTLFAVNVLFVRMFIKMLDKFWKCFVKDYNRNSTWCHIINILNKNKNIYLFIYLFFIHRMQPIRLWRLTLEIAHKTPNIRNLHADVLFDHFFSVRLFP